MKGKFLIALPMLVLAAPAFAEGTGTAATFGSIDANQDGVISREEVSQNENLAGAFSTADTNQDGNLDSVEFSKLSDAESSAKTDG
jgi:hypothetical protein